MPSPGRTALRIDSPLPILPAMDLPPEGPPLHVVVVGAGAFGVPAAIELRARGHDVMILDPGPLPHPDAASTDISKMVRMDYGDDELYLNLGDESLDVWERWNGSWTPDLFHRTGFLVLTSEAWTIGSFVRDTYEVLERRGQPVERMKAQQVRERFPAWDSAVEWDGYVNRRAGWAESGRVVESLIERAGAVGVEVVPGESFAGFVERGSRVAGVRLASGREVAADHVVMAAGAWTPVLLPELADRIWALGQPVFHFQVDEPAAFQPPAFLPWAADISTAGWYGFPAKSDGRLKVSNHGPGIRVDPRDPRAVLPSTEEEFRDFLSRALPSVANARVVATRLCLYTETFDNDFWIDRDPARDGVTVATGGSGHGFKFAPVLGPIVADVVEGRETATAHRFRWRELGERRVEPARWGGPDPMAPGPTAEPA